MFSKLKQRLESIIPPSQTHHIPTSDNSSNRVTPSSRSPEDPNNTKPGTAASASKAGDGCPNPTAPTNIVTTPASLRYETYSHQHHHHHHHPGSSQHTMPPSHSYRPISVMGSPTPFPNPSVFYGPHHPLTRQQLMGGPLIPNTVPAVGYTGTSYLPSANPLAVQHHAQTGGLIPTRFAPTLLSPNVFSPASTGGVCSSGDFQSSGGGFRGSAHHVVQMGGGRTPHFVGAPSARMELNPGTGQQPSSSHSGGAPASLVGADASSGDIPAFSTAYGLDPDEPSVVGQHQRSSVSSEPSASRKYRKDRKSKKGKISPENQQPTLDLPSQRWPPSSQPDGPSVHSAPQSSIGSNQIEVIDRGKLLAASLQADRAAAAAAASNNGQRPSGAPPLASGSGSGSLRLQDIMPSHGGGTARYPPTPSPMPIQRSAAVHAGVHQPHSSTQVMPLPTHLTSEMLRQNPDMRDMTYQTPDGRLVRLQFAYPIYSQCTPQDIFPRPGSSNISRRLPQHYQALQNPLSSSPSVSTSSQHRSSPQTLSTRGPYAAYGTMQTGASIGVGGPQTESVTSTATPTRASVEMPDNMVPVSSASSLESGRGSDETSSHSSPREGTTSSCQNVFRQRTKTDIAAAVLAAREVASPATSARFGFDSETASHTLGADMSVMDSRLMSLDVFPSVTGIPTPGSASTDLSAHHGSPSGADDDPGGQSKNKDPSLPDYLIPQPNTQPFSNVVLPSITFDSRVLAEIGLPLDRLELSSGGPPPESSVITATYISSVESLGPHPEQAGPSISHGNGDLPVPTTPDQTGDTIETEVVTSTPATHGDQVDGERVSTDGLMTIVDEEEAVHLDKNGEARPLIPVPAGDLDGTMLVEVGVSASDALTEDKDDGGSSADADELAGGHDLKRCDSTSSTSSSSTSNSEGFDSSSEESSRKRRKQMMFEAAWIPLKDDSTPMIPPIEPLYLDPSTQQAIPLSAWVAKHGEMPRPSLLAPPSAQTGLQTAAAVATNPLSSHSGAAAIVRLPPGILESAAAAVSARHRVDEAIDRSDYGRGASAVSGSRFLATFGSQASFGHSDDSWGVLGPGAMTEGFEDQFAMPHRGLSFADMVAAQIAAQGATGTAASAVVSAAASGPVTTTPNLGSQGASPTGFAPKIELMSPSTPNPQPSGPVALFEDDAGNKDRIGGSKDNGSLFSLGDSNALCVELFDIDEHDTRQAVDELQRSRGIAARIECYEESLKILSGAPAQVDMLQSERTAAVTPSSATEARGRLGPLSSAAQRTMSPTLEVERDRLKKAYEEEIERLKHEAEEAKKRAAEEHARWEEEKQENLKQLRLLQEKRDDDELRKRQEEQLLEVAKKTKQMQQLLEKLTKEASNLKAGKEFIPFHNHGVTAVQLHIARLGNFSVAISTVLKGGVTFYAIVELGDADLHSRASAVGMPEILAATVDHGARHRAADSGGGRSRTCSDASGGGILWNDTFNFPYLNERHLSVTVRAKDCRDDGREFDVLIGAARLDLEFFILNPAACGPQILQLYGSDSTPVATAHIVLQLSNEVLPSPFMSAKPREMVPMDLEINRTLSTAFFGIDASSTKGSNNFGNTSPSTDCTRKGTSGSLGAPTGSTEEVVTRGRSAGDDAGTGARSSEVTSDSTSEHTDIIDAAGHCDNPDGAVAATPATCVTDSSTCGDGLPPYAEKICETSENVAGVTIESKAGKMPTVVGSADKSGPASTDHVESVSMRLRSSDSLQQLMHKVDFRTLSVLKHGYSALRIFVSSAKGLKLGPRTRDMMASVRITLLGSHNCSSEALTTSIQDVVVRTTKKGRLYAAINYDEECKFPLERERQVKFQLLDYSDAKNMQKDVGSGVLNLQRLLMTGQTWFRRKVALENSSGKKISSLDLTLQFLTENLTVPIVAPSQDLVDPNTWREMPMTDQEKALADRELLIRDERLILVEEAAAMLVSPTSCHVTVESASGLVIPTGLKTVTPYVRVKLGQFEASTTRALGQECKWKLQDGLFVFDLTCEWETQLLTLECYSAGHPNDRLIGLTVLSIVDVATLPGRFFRGELTVFNKYGDQAGTIVISVQLSS